MSNEEHDFHGVHILGEMYGIDPELLNDLDFLERILSLGISESGATLCGLQKKQFDPQGVTLLALLSESHASIHTYPDKGALFFDAFTCGDRCQPQRIAEILVEHLQPVEKELRSIQRGAESKTVAVPFPAPILSVSGQQ